MYKQDGIELFDGEFYWIKIKNNNPFLHIGRFEVLDFTDEVIFYRFYVDGSEIPVDAEDCIVISHIVRPK